MSKIKKLPKFKFKSIEGKGSPEKIINEFIKYLGLEPNKSLKDDADNFLRWTVEEGDNELEIILDSPEDRSLASVYMGINITLIPLKNCQEFLVTALEIADGLVAAKVSIVGNFLVLSCSLNAYEIDLNALDFYYKLLDAQLKWFKERLEEEMGFFEE